MRFRLPVTVSLVCAASFCVACAPAATTTAGPSKLDVVTAADIEQFPNETIEHLVSRKVSGVSLIRTGSGGDALIIRNSQSITGEPRPPIYIVDNMRMSAGPEGEFPAIDAKDIEVLRVLKGADAAIYGIEGANGVIVITTKRGKARQ